MLICDHRSSFEKNVRIPKWCRKLSVKFDDGELCLQMGFQKKRYRVLESAYERGPIERGQLEISTDCYDFNFTIPPVSEFERHLKAVRGDYWELVIF